MLSLRLQTIASFVENDDYVADIGCDHAYLSIYLTKNNLCKKVIATDINKNALNEAFKNINKERLEDKIPVYLSDGLTNIPDKNIDTLIISGMGTSTILKIVKNSKNFNIKKLIIQSNNDLYKLRKNMMKLGFYLQKEKVIYEKNHYYVVGVYTKKYNHLSIREKYFGTYDSSFHDYYINEYNSLLNINKKIKPSLIKKKLILLLKIKLLKKYL